MKRCIRCGTPFAGRSDKTFCSAECKNLHNNQVHRERYRKVFEINRILKRNYLILHRMHIKGLRRRSYADLIQQGFDFMYSTSSGKEGRRFFSRWRGCYDLKYRRTWRGVEVTRESDYGCNS